MTKLSGRLFLSLTLKTLAQGKLVIRVGDDTDTNSDTSIDTITDTNTDIKKDTNADTD